MALQIVEVVFTLGCGLYVLVYRVAHEKHTDSSGFLSPKIKRWSTCSNTTQLNISTPEILQYYRIEKLTLNFKRFSRRCTHTTELEN